MRAEVRLSDSSIIPFLSIVSMYSKTPPTGPPFGERLTKSSTFKAETQSRKNVDGPTPRYCAGDVLVAGSVHSTELGGCVH